MKRFLLSLISISLLLTILAQGCVFTAAQDEGPVLPGPSKLRELVREVYDIKALSITTDGKQMLYATTARPGADGLSIVIRDAIKGTPLQLYQYTPITSASWAPDSSITYLAQSDADEIKSIGVMQEQGMGMENIVDLMGFSFVSTPVWSPDGRFIAFWSRKNPDENTAEYSLWMVRPDGSDLKALYGGTGVTTIGAFSGDLRWSPDTSKLLFTMGKGNAINAFVLERREGKPKNLTSNYLKVSDLFWAPSGKRIAYAAIENERPNGPPKIGIMNADGSGKTLLGPSGWPVGWIPNSGELAYISSDGTLKNLRASHTLEAVDVKTKARRVLAKLEEETIVAAATSSDSRVFFVTADDQGYGKIMVVE